MSHQHTQLPTGNFPRRKSNLTSGQKLQNCKMPDVPTTWKTPNMPRPEAHSEKCNRCRDTPHAKGFQCQARKFQCKICHKFGHFTSVCFQKKPRPTLFLFLSCKETEKHNNYMQGHFTPSKMQGAVNIIQTQKRTSAYK